MNKTQGVWLLSGVVSAAVVVAVFHDTKPRPTALPGKNVGSQACKACHERFYQLWSSSFHGSTVQPFTVGFYNAKLTPQATDIEVGEHRYRTEVDSEGGWVKERGPGGEKKYRIEHAMGGKNVYYFLTPMDRGRLQVLPVAYDVREQKWFHTAASAVRHFSDTSEEAPLDWKDPAYVFNTGCHSCHVSQLSTNYDRETNTYRTTWEEPGIRCETCHGPADEHVRVCRAAADGQVPADLKLIRGGRDFTAEQNNMACASCHARRSLYSSSFKAGDNFFDHFDLVALEHRDFFPDGRDLGENYTYTLWKMSPCAKSGRLDCLHCHTSSGRYRFTSKGHENDACLPCHQERVANAAAHTHHPAGSEGSRCISCHMPKTEFARIRRSDHSMLPPTPATTMRYGSPNACNLCHTDKNASWANDAVRRFHERDYQARVLHRAGLIQAARDQDWDRLDEMLDYLGSEDRDEVYVTSLIRLLTACGDERKWPGIRRALGDPSALVRAAAAASMAGSSDPQSIGLLLAGIRDGSLLVRIRSTQALAGLPLINLEKRDRDARDRAGAEFEAAMLARPDDFVSYYNLGNYYVDVGRLQQAVQMFEKATELRADSILPLVNVASVYAKLGNHQKAKASLAAALVMDPDSAEANFNMGLLKAENNDPAGAEKHLRAALRTDADFPEAAYNLGLLLAPQDPEEALLWLRKAHGLSPKQPKYTFATALHLRKHNKTKEAVELLTELITQDPAWVDAYLLLGEIYEDAGNQTKAAGVYRQALSVDRPGTKTWPYLRSRINEIESKTKSDSQ